MTSVAIVFVVGMIFHLFNIHCFISNKPGWIADICVLSKYLLKSENIWQYLKFVIWRQQSENGEILIWALDTLLPNVPAAKILIIWNDPFKLILDSDPPPPTPDLHSVKMSRFINYMINIMVIWYNMWFITLSNLLWYAHVNVKCRGIQVDVTLGCHNVHLPLTYHYQKPLSRGQKGVFLPFIMLELCQKVLSQNDSFRIPHSSSLWPVHISM